MSGQVAVGKNIGQVQHTGDAEGLTDPEREELQQIFATLRERVLEEAPEDLRAPAFERVEELQEALSADEPDLGTAQYVKRWFLKRLPGLAGLITGVFVNPVIGKLVQSAGDVAFAELLRIAEE